MRSCAVLWAGAAVLCCLLAARAQNSGCGICDTHRDGKCDSSGGTGCSCTLNIGPDVRQVNCKKLIPKCLLMKKESIPGKGGRRPKPAGALVDNDGLYNPDCEADGTFKARQCNGTETCWCVNSAGVRRTEKGDKQTKTCPELVRTFWVVVQMKRNNTDTVSDADLKAALKQVITQRYNLSAAYISNIEFEGPYIYIDLMQNSSQKAAGDIDIADVGYYMEKDIKGDPIMHPDNKFQIPINGNNFLVQEPLIMYIDEKPHELSMKRLTAGVIAVIVVVVIAIVAGIVVLVITRRKRGKYEKAEMKEMNEMQRELTS
ncbi:epithelial cell adhesion molecule isoform X2 [Dendropsophus ebraccatus]|uniref:epithelial cell adhesion molecule isoform X2 n=1 Tax=Dendropsophus ebraccatus TaxID=150705 RepID=UPI00383220DE